MNNMSHLNSVGGTSEGNLRPMRGNPIVRGFVDLTKSGYQALEIKILVFFFRKNKGFWIREILSDYIIV